jgi:phospholipid transport system substrate-binding protein
MKLMQELAVGFMLVFGASASALPPPDQEIRQTTEQLQAAIREHKAEYQGDSGKFYAMVDQIILPHFDTRAIGKLVLGANWKQASDAQRERFIKAFKNSLTYSYADALLKYADTVKADWKPLKMAPDAAEATVNAELMRPAGPPIAIGFSVHQADNAWKVYDVTVDGISLGVNFRQQFNAEIKANGLDALIARLEGGGKPLADEKLKKG